MAFCKTRAIVEEQVYDSDARPGARALARQAWGLRELVALLARRELTARYEQALLGAAWALVTPLAYAAALYVVFSEVARFATPGVPFVVYVLSGVIVLNFVSAAIIATAGAVVQNAVSLRRLAVPIGVFVAATAVASMVTLFISVVALLVVQVAVGEGIPLTVFALPVAVVPLAVAAAAAGLLVGSLAAVFTDALEMTRVALTLAGFLTPVFYPISIVPDRWRFLVEANPLYQFLVLFRALAYEGRFPPVTTIAVVLGWAVAITAAGAVVFVRMRRALPSVL